jgi:hypothetical protein
MTLSSASSASLRGRRSAPGVGNIETEAPGNRGSMRLGIRGSRIEFSLVGDHVEMRVRSSRAGERPAAGSACSRAGVPPCRRTSMSPRCSNPCTSDDRPGRQRSRPVLHRRRGRRRGAAPTAGSPSPHRVGPAPDGEQVGGPGTRVGHAWLLRFCEAGIDFADALHHASYRSCDSVATFDDRKFARWAKKLGLAPT